MVLYGSATPMQQQLHRVANLKYLHLCGKFCYTTYMCCAHEPCSQSSGVCVYICNSNEWKNRPWIWKRTRSVICMGVKEGKGWGKYCNYVIISKKLKCRNKKQTSFPMLHIYSFIDIASILEMKPMHHWQFHLLEQSRNNMLSIIIEHWK